MMKIEFGKFYKTRDHRKVRIYATDGGNGYPIHGAVYFSSDGWCFNNWCADGKLRDDGEIRGNDLVSEWVEPRPRLLAWRRPDSGTVMLWSDYPSDDRHHRGIRWERVPHLDEPEGGE